ncbi:polysaccharide pyruvyl transferase family protein [Vibrio cyclitrophicus]|nr:polysaccharide pyruvyl transferase family protein [Vibrio cyclitrophicus]PMJ29987.1 hypothetical protein BCU25_17810 [Vibrio cyclitrophicus]
MNNVVLLNDTSKDLNWGCKTTSFYLKKLLCGKDKSIENIPISFSNSFKERLSGHCKLLFLYFNLGFLLILFRVPLRFYFMYISWNKNHYKKIEKSTYVILNGEGTIHVFNRAVAKWMFYLLVSKYVFNKKYAIVNHTFNLDTKSVKNICREAYIKSNLIFTREPISRDIIISELGVDPNKIKVVGDAAFMVETQNHETVTNEKEKYFTICGNVRRSDEETKNLVNLVKDLHLSTGYIPVFLEADSADSDLFQLLNESIGDVRLIENNTPVSYSIDFIKKSEFFITGRFHPFIFGLITNTKMFTFKSNTHKIEGVKSLINFPVGNISLKDPFDDLNYILTNIDNNSTVDDGSINNIASIINTIKEEYSNLSLKMKE